jgi:hypothetical protein
LTTPARRRLDKRDGRARVRPDSRTRRLATTRPRVGPIPRVGPSLAAVPTDS